MDGLGALLRVAHHEACRNAQPPIFMSNFAASTYGEGYAFRFPDLWQACQVFGTLRQLKDNTEPRRIGAPPLPNFCLVEGR